MNTKQREELVQEGRNQVLYLLLAIGDEYVAHDHWHPDKASFLLEVRRKIVLRLREPDRKWPSDAGRPWPDFETYTYSPG